MVGVDSGEDSDGTAVIMREGVPLSRHSEPSATTGLWRVVTYGTELCWGRGALPRLVQACSRPPALQTFTGHRPGQRRSHDRSNFTIRQVQRSERFNFKLELQAFCQHMLS